MDVSNDVAIKNVSNQGGIYPLRTAMTPDSSLLVTGSLSNAWHIVEYADGSFDFAFPLQTNPTLVMHSANQATDQWGSLAHDSSNFVIATGLGGVAVSSTSATSTVLIGGPGTVGCVGSWDTDNGDYSWQTTLNGSVTWSTTDCR